MTTASRRPFSAKLVVLAIIIAAFFGLAATVWRQRSTASVRVESGSSDTAIEPIPIAQCLARMPVRVARHVYLLGDLRPSAVYIVETSHGLAMIDTGLESAHDTLLAGMSKLNLDPGRLKLILLTHAHGDHTMGAERLRDETGAKVYIGHGDAETLRRGGPWEAIFSKFDMQGEGLHPTTIDGELTDGQVLELGEARFTVVATPGHTAGSCCFLLEIDGQRLLFTGDTISTFTVSTGTYSARLPPRYGGDVGQYLTSLEKLRSIPAPDMVLPGHPASDLAMPDPHVDADDWRALVDRGIADLQKVSDRYARDGADFLDGEPKKLLDGFYYLGDFEGHSGCALLSGDSALVFDAARGADAAAQITSAWERLEIVAPKIAAVAITSCDAENLSGLRPLVESTGCRVIAPQNGLGTVAEAYGNAAVVVSADDLQSLGWSDVRAVPIAGSAFPEAAYYFRRDDRTVLITGVWPIDADADEMTRMVRQGVPPGVEPQSLTASLEVLENVDPDVWVAAVPWQGRNANVYDRAWTSTLLWNLQLLGNRDPKLPPHP